MIRQHRASLVIASILLAAGSLTLAGCTSAPQIKASASALAQKASEACQNVSERLAAFDAKIDDTLNRVGSGDAGGAQQSFADARSDLSKAMSNVQNPQIQKALENVDASTSKLGDLIAGLSTSSPAAELATKAASDAQDAAKQIQEASDKLSALCPTSK
jgi:predicted PurR-regulated permease PerM